MKRRTLTVALLAMLTSAVAWLPPTPAEAATPPVASGVMGQAGNFTTNGASATATNFSAVAGTAHDLVRHRLFVADRNNSRVVVFNLNADNTLPDDTADYVLGQGSFTTYSSNLTQTGLGSANAIAYDSVNDRVYVVDSSYNRVMVWDTSSITNGKPAAYVLGQSSFTNNAIATTQSGLSQPLGVAVAPNGRWVFVADSNNRRVMVWDMNTPSNGMNATHVLGKADFVSNASAVTASQMAYAAGVAVDGANNRLYASDTNNRRVLAFDLNNLATGMSASFVLGQADFTSYSPRTDQTSFNGPGAISVGGGKVFVADHTGNRVMVWDTSTTTNNAPAIGLYGQSSYTTSNANDGGRSATSLNEPRGVDFDPTTFKLFVSDLQNHRVLVFDTAQTGVTVSGTVAPIFTFSVVGRATTCNGQSTTGFQTGATASSVSLGSLSTTAVNGAAQDLSVSSNAAGGFIVYLRTTNTVPNAFRDAAGHAVADVSGAATSPGAAPVAGTEGFGFTSSDVLTPFTNNTWAKVTATNVTAITAAANTTAKNACVGYAAAIASTTIAGTYSAPIIYTAVPTF